MPIDSRHDDPRAVSKPTTSTSLEIIMNLGGSTFIRILVYLIVAATAVGCMSRRREASRELRLSMQNMRISVSRPRIRPAANAARVVFVRPHIKGQSPHAISIWERNRLLAFLRGSEKSYVDVSPGHHKFLAVVRNADVLEADLLGGRTYYVLCRFVRYHYYGSNVFIDPLHQNHEEWRNLRNWMSSTQTVAVNPAESFLWTQRHALDNDKRMQRYAARPYEKRKFLLPEHGIAY